MITETIYAGRDNSFSLQLVRGEDPIALLALTGYELVLSNGTTITDQSRFVEKDNGIVEIAIGDLVTPGVYVAYLVSFDMVNVNGVRWPEFKLKVK